jgi:hypothetical protein
MTPTIHRGPRGTVYGCPICKRAEFIKRGGAGSGRGYGLRTGGGAYSRMVAHINEHNRDEAEREEERRRMIVQDYISEGLGE